MPRHLRTLALLLALAPAASLFAQASRDNGGTRTREDLSAVNLPKGDTFIPTPDHPDASRGYIFHFEKPAQFAVLPRPEPGQPRSTQALVERMRSEKTGDLLYRIDKEGAPGLLVISGKARDLGNTYLNALSGKALDKPDAWPPANPEKNVTVSGFIRNLQEGHAYLIDTVEGGSALLRVVALGAAGVQIQWVYSREPVTSFTIPGGLTMDAVNLKVDVVPNAAGTATLATAPATQVASTTQTAATQPATHNGAATSLLNGPRIATQPSSSPRLIMATPTRPAEAVLIPYFSTWLRQRDALIKERLARLDRAPRTEREVAEFRDTVNELGELHAVEAVDGLIARINFLDARAREDADTMVRYHPAVAALTKLGKPASAAALRGIHDLKPSADPLEAPEYRTMLLVAVIRNVEGPDVAEFLLKRELAKADETHKHYFEQALRQLTPKP